ncbi:MAG TPA: hypothetical protein VIL35_05105 [Vicinamibacterales bacterium]
MSASHAQVCAVAPPATFMERINSTHHELALRLYMVIVLAHWAEHLLQAFQIYVLGWPVPQALGALGLLFPWLVKSEVLHYGYALVMLAGLWMLRTGFTGERDRKWWMVAFWIQFFHHIEHALLQAQAILGMNFFDRPVPTSLVQLWVPRVELHLFYNTIVFVPMVIAMYYHMFPSAKDAGGQQCTCAWRRPLADAA